MAQIYESLDSRSSHPICSPPPPKKKTGSEAALFLSERAAAFLDDCEICEVETAFISGVGGGGRELRTRGCAISARASVWADDDRPSVWQPPIEASLTHALLLLVTPHLFSIRSSHSPTAKTQNGEKQDKMQKTHNDEQGVARLMTDAIANEMDEIAEIEDDELASERAAQRAADELTEMTQLMHASARGVEDDDKSSTASLEEQVCVCACVRVCDCASVLLRESSKG